MEDMGGAGPDDEGVCNTPVLQSYLAPRIRPKKNFRNEFLKFLI